MKKKQFSSSILALIYFVLLILLGHLFLKFNKSGKITQAHAISKANIANESFLEYSSDHILQYEESSVQAQKKLCIAALPNNGQKNWKKK